MNYYNYFTEIEEHFVRRRGKHILVSPMDWSLIAAWRDSGVPLHVALRGIDKAMDGFLAKKHRAGRVHSLFYCHESVMEEYARHLESRVGETEAPAAAGEDTSPASDSSQGEGPAREAILDFLSERISEMELLRTKHTDGEHEALRSGLDRILSRLVEFRANLQEAKRISYESLERDLGILDEALTNELRPFVPSEETTRWEEEAKRELKIYRRKLPKETFQRILQNFLRARIHQYFRIGELSLFHL